MIGLLLLLLVAVGIALAVRRATGQGGAEASDGFAVRRAFQYLLLYGLLVVVCAGLSGLIGRALETDVLLATDESALARDLAFTVVGLPVLAGVALWTRRRLAAVPGERRSLGWALYVTAAALTSLLVATSALVDVLEEAVGLADHDGSALATVLVWGSSWAVHWWLDARVTPARRTVVHHLAGSLVGLVTAATGLAAVLAGTVRAVVDPVSGELLAGAGNPALQGLVTLAVGAPVWWLYWIRTASRRERSGLWLGYVLLAGIAGGLLTAVTLASTLLYTVLVWVLGDPGSASAGRHFQDAPAAAAIALTGLLVWWYHQAFLGRAGAGPRTEVRRLQQYLVAAIGLLAAAAGLGTVLVAFVESLTGPGRTLAGESTVNTLLAAATLLVVGGPLWWAFWRRIQHAVATEPAAEVASAVRRAYLLVLFGLGGLAAVIALITGVFLLFEDVVAGTAGAGTVFRMRFAIGVLLTTAAVAAYHWAVLRSDRALAPEEVTPTPGPAATDSPSPGTPSPGTPSPGTPPPGTPAAGTQPAPDLVLLVGAAGPEVAEAVARHTGGRVRSWARTDEGSPPLSTDEVLAALAGTTGAVLVLRDAAGPRAIPVSPEQDHAPS